MSGMDRLTEREWLISLLTIEQEQMLTDYEVHPDAWKGDPERADSTAALADGILDGLAHRRASQAASKGCGYPCGYDCNGACFQAAPAQEDDQFVTTLPQEAFDAFAKACDEAPAPSDGLREALGTLLVQANGVEPRDAMLRQSVIRIAGAALSASPAQKEYIPAKPVCPICKGHSRFDQCCCHYEASHD